MRYTTIIALAGLGLAIPQCAASVPELRGSLDTGYTNSKAAGITVTSYGGGGDMLVTFPDWGVGLQGGGSYWKFNSEGHSANLWNANAHAFWRNADGMLGASIGYSSLGTGVLFGVGPLNFNARMYGAFGEYYATNYMTFRAKGGALQGSLESVSGHLNGGYVGLGGEYYILPDFAVSLAGNYVSLSHARFTSFEASSEYLLSEEIPLSLTVGYRYTAATGGLRANTLMAGLKYRFGPSGSLIQQDRTGPLVWNGILDLNTLEL